MSSPSSRDRELRERAQRVIPGGMYGHQSVALLPDEYPQFFQRARGARLWDVDGREYVDYLCGYGPNLFGYGCEPIDRAAAAQQALGDTMSGPAAVMVDLAESMVGMVSHADWAILCKDGSDATTLAMVVARAHTGRKKILVAQGAYHGSAPWCTPRLAGIIAEDRVHIGHYDPNDIGSLESLLRTHAGSVAAVFVSPFRHDVFRDQTTPDAIFAKAVRRCCDESGALLVLDDIRAGFRLARDGSWEALGVRPDLSTWGKSIANGYALSALLGSESLRESARLPYVTGSFWFSATAMAAATETLRQIKTTNYLEHIVDMGSRLRAGLKQQAGNYGFALRQSGPVQMPQILFEDDPDFRFGYAWVGECVQRGVYLHPFHNMFLSAAHGEPELAATLKATDDAFAKLKERRATLKPNTKLSAFAAR
jgi:glutamate-1-semialdehyde 2,1-aminomutase